MDSVLIGSSIRSLSYTYLDFWEHLRHYYLSCNYCGNNKILARAGSNE